MTFVNTYISEVILLASFSELSRNQDVHKYQTRNATNFNLPAHKRKHYEDKTTYAGSKLFNVLPLFLILWRDVLGNPQEGNWSSIRKTSNNAKSNLFFIFYNLWISLWLNAYFCYDIFTSYKYNYTNFWLGNNSHKDFTSLSRNESSVFWTAL